jgi:hypothetical protein
MGPRRWPCQTKQLATFLYQDKGRLRADQPSNKKLVCVCTESRARRTQDGIDILPVTEFLSRLWQGDYAS